VQDDRLVHQAIELAEKFVDLFDRRLFVYQTLYVFAELSGQRTIYKNFSLVGFVDDFVAAIHQRYIAIQRRKFNDAIVGAVIDHLHGNTPLATASRKFRELGPACRIKACHVPEPHTGAGFAHRFYLDTVFLYRNFNGVKRISKLDGAIWINFKRLPRNIRCAGNSSPLGPTPA
jgi:hypothetical protein